MNSCKRAISFVMALVLMLCISAPAFAASEGVYTSNYIAYYDGGVTKSSTGTVKVWFDVGCYSDVEELGASEIKLYEMKQGSSTWSLVKTFKSSVYTSMVTTNDMEYDSSVTYSGTSTSNYKATITIFAESGTKSDVRTFTRT